MADANLLAVAVLFLLGAAWYLVVGAWYLVVGAWYLLALGTCSERFPLLLVTYQ